MIFYIVKRYSFSTVADYMRSTGLSIEPLLYKHFKAIFYEKLGKLKRLPKGTYIFSDLERLSSQETNIADRVYEQLKKANMKVLNNPLLSMRRYELLRTLFEVGVNEFNVYRPTECRQPSKFPVFLHSESKHDGDYAKLITKPEELCNALTNYFSLGNSREDTLIEEFCDTSNNEGIMKKYSAFRIGDHILPQHLMIGKGWVQKAYEAGQTQKEIDEEKEYIGNNSHEKELKAIFNIASIDYGRIDYGVKNGKIQVWEINTNPFLNPVHRWCPVGREEIRLTRARRFHLALHSINTNFHSDSKIGNPIAEEGLLMSTLRFIFSLLPLNIRKKIKVVLKPFSSGDKN